MEQRLRQINDVSIGNNLRNLRNAANLTQEQVVAQLQLRNLPTTRSIYSQIEAGTYNIKVSELIALPKYFIPISTQYLMDYLTINNPGSTVFILSSRVLLISHILQLYTSYSSIPLLCFFFVCCSTICFFSSNRS